MKTEKDNRKAKHNNRRAARKNTRVLVAFFVTFICVVVVGLLAMSVYSRMQDNQEEMAETKKDESYAELAYEDIPDDAALVQAQPEEIEEVADEDETVPEGRYGEVLADEEYMKENHIYEKTAESEDEITITFAGDILFDPGYSVMNALINNQYDISKCISDEVLDIMRGSDIMMVNNEFPYSDRGEPLPEKQFTFRAPTKNVSILDDMGVDIVSLANNHAYDYGESALIDSCDTLEKAGMPYVGAGRNKSEAQKTSYFIVNDTKIAILSATQIERLDTPDTKAATDTSAGVFRCWNNKELLEKIGEAKANSDFVIVYIHWGTENEEGTDWAQDKQAPEMAEAGADLIIGDHPHCLQKLDVAGGVPVVYSLGNFWFNSKTLDTGLVKATIADDQLKSLQFIPCLQSGCRTTLMHGEEKGRVLNYLNSLSSRLTLDADGYALY